MFIQRAESRLNSKQEGIRSRINHTKLSLERRINSNILHDSSLHFQSLDVEFCDSRRAHSLVDMLDDNESLHNTSLKDAALIKINAKQTFQIHGYSVPTLSTVSLI